MSTLDQKGPVELVPPDPSTLKYALGEFAVYRDLYPMSKTGQASVRAIIETLEGISGADSKKAVSLAVESVVGKWLVAEDDESPMPTPLPASLPATTDDHSLVCAEVARREEWLSEVSEAQSDIEALLGEVEDRLQKNAEVLRFGSEEEVVEARKKGPVLALQRQQILKARDSFTALREPAKRELERLQQYKRALEVVRSGCPQGLVGNVLPSIPVFTESDMVLASTDTPEMPGENVAQPLMARGGALASIALENGMSEAEVFIVSLYDLFGPGNERLVREHGRRSLNRGLRRVIQSALTIFTDVRWRSHQECYNEVRESGRQIGESGLIEYRGSLQSAMTFSRTEKLLPWSSSMLFSETEIAAFIDVMAQPSQNMKE